MDVLIDLLPSVNRVKTEHSKKDKRQRNKYNRQMKGLGSDNRDVSRVNQNDSSASFKQVFWTGPERRASVDRRQLKNKRGRWLESRGRKDRRTVEHAISVKI